MFDIEGTTAALESYMKRTGYYGSVTIGEPTQPPEAKDRVHGCLLWQSFQVVAVTNTPIELHIILARLFMDRLDREIREIELGLAKAANFFCNEVYTGFNLEQQNLYVDIAGEYGTPVGARTGFLTFSGFSYRTADVTLPLVVSGPCALLHG